MLCVAKVNLSDWPEGQRREVDPMNERISGLLRAGYIVGLRLPSPAPLPSPGIGPGTSLSPGAEAEDADAPKRARKPRRAADE